MIVRPSSWTIDLAAAPPSVQTLVSGLALFRPMLAILQSALPICLTAQSGEMFGCQRSPVYAARSQSVG